MINFKKTITLLSLKDEPVFKVTFWKKNIIFRIHINILWFFKYFISWNIFMLSFILMININLIVSICFLFILTSYLLFNLLFSSFNADLMCYTLSYNKFQKSLFWYGFNVSTTVFDDIEYFCWFLKFERKGIELSLHFP